MRSTSPPRSSSSATSSNEPASAISTFAEQAGHRLAQRAAKQRMIVGNDQTIASRVAHPFFSRSRSASVVDHSTADRLCSANHADRFTIAQADGGRIDLPQVGGGFELTSLRSIWAQGSLSQARLPMNCSTISRRCATSRRRTPSRRLHHSPSTDPRTRNRRANSGAAIPRQARRRSSRPHGRSVIAVGHANLAGLLPSTSRRARAAPRAPARAFARSADVCAGDAKRETFDHGPLSPGGHSERLRDHGHRASALHGSIRHLGREQPAQCHARSAAATRSPPPYRPPDRPAASEPLPLPRDSERLRVAVAHADLHPLRALRARGRDGQPRVRPQHRGAQFGAQIERNREELRARNPW